MEYDELIEKAEICDKRYPVKGMNVWLDYGNKIMHNIEALIREAEDGIKKSAFPF